MTVRELTVKVEREYGVSRYDVAEELTQYDMDEVLTSEEVDAILSSYEINKEGE